MLFGRAHFVPSTNFLYIRVRVFATTFFYVYSCHSRCPFESFLQTNERKQVEYVRPAVFCPFKIKSFKMNGKAVLFRVFARQAEAGLNKVWSPEDRDAGRFLFLWRQRYSRH